MAVKVNWAEAVKPLLKKYRKKKHPLEYKNLYQLMMMVVLSAQSTDHVVNLISPALFDAYPSMESLAKAKPEDLIRYISKVRNFRNKAKWMIGIAKAIKKEENIPVTMEELVELPGIGRKSASVIQREAGVKPEGVIVDLHVVRVAQRLGITKASDPKQIEKDIMAVVPPKDWEVGMSISFLGRETCRPTDPKHAECVMNPVCMYYASLKKKKTAKPKKKSK
jgi:endonuclease-3